ncbi:MAG: twin-arginine translocase TatA/TatE family subunit [Anaerolineae bacterium]|nr:twin-arginine translocase TatA/TatE family subunit [Anaerolineae bacterium]
MPHLGVWELVIILVIVLIIFGASRLTDIGKGLGGAISSFRKEVKKGAEEKPKEEENE